MEEPFGSCDPDVCEFTTFSGLKKKKARILKETTTALQLLSFAKGSYMKERVLIKCLQGHCISAYNFSTR